MDDKMYRDSGHVSDAGARANTVMRRYLHFLGKINDWIGNKTLQNSGVTPCNMRVSSSNVLFCVKERT